MAEHPIQGLMGVTIDKIREMVDTSTIIGDPIHVDEATTIIPVSRVTFGFASGGSDVAPKAEKAMFGGGTGAGVSVTPVAFLVIKDGLVRTIQLSDPSNSLDRALTMLPELVDRLLALIPEKPEKAEKAGGAGTE